MKNDTTTTHGLPELFYSGRRSQQGYEIVTNNGQQLQTFTHLQKVKDGNRAGAPRQNGYSLKELIQ